jgi:hypothetical protein
MNEEFYTYPITYGSHIDYQHVGGVRGEDEQSYGFTQDMPQQSDPMTDTLTEAVLYGANEECQGWSFTEQDELGWLMGNSETESCEYPSSADEYATIDSSENRATSESAFVPSSTQGRNLEWPQQDTQYDCAPTRNNQIVHGTTDTTVAQIEYRVFDFKDESPRVSSSSDRKRPRRLSKFSQRQIEKEEANRYRASGGAEVSFNRWM